MAGLGKTTLSKMVLKEVKDRKLFDVIFWICVSGSFDDERILGEMLHSIDKNTGGISNINTIMTNLERQLKDKKFLLVLDDVWNEEYGKWESLRDRLLKVVGINHGNAVVVTTRLPLVASIMENPPVFRHELKQLCQMMNVGQLLGK